MFYFNNNIYLCYKICKSREKGSHEKTTVNILIKVLYLILLNFIGKTETNLKNLLNLKISS